MLHEKFLDRNIVKGHTIIQPVTEINPFNLTAKVWCKGSCADYKFEFSVSDHVDLKDSNGADVKLNITSELKNGYFYFLSFSDEEQQKAEEILQAAYK